ncbi:putative Phospholipid-transporting ATPase [Seiridium cardinale]|uniref:Phospholipid-transporting ATPase n=1 Tax=Seiridium cardinale TaxID=138064 RepID=A0ABR2X9H4_9PEZI
MERHGTPAASSSHGRKSRPRHLEHIRTHSAISVFSRGHKQNSSISVADADEPRFDLEHYRAWARRQRKKARDNGWVRLEKGFNDWYQKWIIEMLLRQYPLPPSKDGRHIPVAYGDVRKTPLKDERTANSKPYMSNFIRSTRYTLWTFFPKQLYFQFSKLANFYFLIIAILQAIPGLSTVGTYTTLATLIPFVAISMAKEGWDDNRRYQLDKKENRSEVSVLDPDGTVAASKKSGKSAKARNQVDTEMALDDLNAFSSEKDAWPKIQWQDLRVGDIIRLRRDDNVPADMVLLHATGPSGVAYIETMALDGETNLKSKQACSLLAKQCDDLSKIKHCRAEVVSEDPNNDLYNYEGRVTVDGETMPLTLNEVVYRGSVLRNTACATGLVINTGEECKIRMNANREIHAKMPAMQRKINHIVLFLVAFVAFLAVGLTTANEIWKAQYLPKASYIRGSVPVKEILIGYIIMFNTLIPISLIVSLEIIKLGQLFLLQDVEMYDAETNTPMVANTTTILEDLGQVSYVFSDKTGTLTENKMRFRKLSVAGNAFLHDLDVKRDEEEKQRRIESFKGKGKMKNIYPVIGSNSVEPIKTPLIGHAASASRRPSTNVWTSTARPAHAQPEVNTERLLHYIYQKPNTAFSKKARQFLLCIALCHTCLPETKDDGKIEFQAASPDELALVQAAQDLGYLLVDRLTQSVVLQIKNSEDGPVSTEKYEVLDVIDFSSKRKRMSIVIRMPDGSLCIICKGADNVVLPRLRLAHLAMQKASDISRKATLRKSVEATRALHRKSVQTQRSIDIVRAASAKQQNFRGVNAPNRASILSDEVANWLDQRENEDLDDEGHGETYRSPIVMSPASMGAEDELDGIVDEFVASSDGAIFERCFQHIDDFASEGLRTLLYAYRDISEEEYGSWRKIYQAATTSLVDRKRRVEEAGEMIEQGFHLAGATAIEDKLQAGVPETIDKLRRANVKVWMLTGDKRETAINIAHSARICKPFSEVYILDATKDDLQETMASTLIEVGRGMIAHSVVVIDGHTLSVVDEDETLKAIFFDLAVRVDSIICCRASPSQKANLVKCIRDTVPSSITLAIGDGANDIAMIQASHVGIGISGREGLQAARTSDYSIAQFRFLQRLLFVHGRWNYLRTGKYVLATFWKEMFFFLAQAQYQRWNGYTGTSLIENISLAVFNSLFTSLCVILPGIFEKDLEASTLLAVPELYTYGQHNGAFKYKKYIGWTTMAILESIIMFSMVQQLYGWCATDLFSMGQLVFTVAVIFINTKLLVLEMHNKTIIPLTGWLLMVGAWFLWNIFLATSGMVHKNDQIQFPVNNKFTRGFGKEALWWITCLLVLATLCIFELCVTALRRVYFPMDQDLWQEIEHQGAAKVLEEHAITDAERGGVQQDTGVSGLGLPLGKIDSGGTVESG